MSDLAHEYWPVAAVTLFTTLLVLQIPRRALFPSAPPERTADAPFASFAEYDDADYERLVQRVRMAWQVRGRARDGGDDSRTGAFDFDEPLPPPREEPLTDAFFTASALPLPRPASAAGDVLPPSLALVPPALEPLPAPAAAPARDPDLLAPPESLDFQLDSIHP